MFGLKNIVNLVVVGCFLGHSVGADLLSTVGGLLTPTTEGPPESTTVDKYGTDIGLPTFTQDQCPTFVTSGLFEIICAINDTIVSRQAQGILCDIHCQCAHDALWGECIQRNDTGMATIIGQDVANLTNGNYGVDMCTCYYNRTENPPPALWEPASEECIWCKTFKAVVLANLCPPLGLHGRCAGDCVCGHGFERGVCTNGNNVIKNETQCVCSNGPVTQTELDRLEDIDGLVGLTQCGYLPGTI